MRRSMNPCLRLGLSNAAAWWRRYRDASNLYVVLSARDLQPTCRLIARASSDEAAAKLRLAGATVVVSPYIAGGRVMAASALRPLAINFMDLWWAPTMRSRSSVSAVTHCTC